MSIGLTRSFAINSISHATGRKLRRVLCALLRVLVGIALIISIMEVASAQKVDDEPAVESVSRAIMGGDLARAMTMIRTLEARPPADAGAWLDVAMLYCEAGAQDDAERVFRWIEEAYLPPPAISQLIDYTRMLGCSRMPEPSALTFSYGFSAGVTDNVNSGPSQATIRLPDAAPVRELTLLPAYVSRAGAFVGLEASGEYALSTSRHLQAMGSLRVRQYPAEPAFSFQQLMTGLTTQQTSGSRQWDAVLAGSALMLGGDLYETSVSTQAGTWVDLSERVGSPARLGVDISGAVLQYPQNRSYDALLLEIRGKAQWRLLDHTTALGAVGLVSDLSRRERTGGDRHGFMFSFRTETPIDERRQLILHTQQYLLNDAEVYNETLFGNLKRTPNSGFVSVRVQQKLNLRDSIYLQLHRSWRDDRIPLFHMNSTVLMLGYQWQ